MSVLVSRKLIPLVALILLVVLPFLWARSPSPSLAAPAPSSSRILEVDDDVLTVYRAAATSVQDILPNVLHRGVGIDGSARVGSTHGMHLAGNPFGSSWTANQSLNGVRLATGSYQVREVDIALPAEGPAWIVSRSYSALQDDEGSHHTSLGYQGRGWHQGSQPEIVLYDADSNAATLEVEDHLVLVYAADAFVEFQRYADDSVEFKAVNGAAGMVEFEEDENGPDTYTYWDQRGWQHVFFGFDEDADPAKGQFWKVIDPDSLVAYVGHATDKDIAIHGQVSPNIDPGFTATGEIQYAYDSEARRFSQLHGRPPDRGEGRDEGERDVGSEPERRRGGPQGRVRVLRRRGDPRQ